MSASRLVAAALRCYPSGWRRRRGDEAAELAVLLMRDGVPARSIACSYFLGAVRARLALEVRRRVGTVVGALMLAAASLGGPLAFLSATAPAHAATVMRTHHTRPIHLQRREPGLIGSCDDERC